MSGVDREQEADDLVLEARNDLSGMFAILQFGRGHYRRLAASLATIVAATTCVMISARMLGHLVEALVHGASRRALTADAVAYLALESLAVLGQYLGRVNLARVTIEITHSIRLALFSKLSRLPMGYFDHQPLGRTITRLTADVEGIESFFGETLARVLAACITIVVVLVAMVAAEPGFGGLIAIASMPALVFSVALRKPVRYWLRTYRRRSAHLNAKLAENLSGMPVIRIFGLEAWTRGNFAVAARSMYDAGIRTCNWNSFIRPTTVLLSTVPLLLVLWLGGARVVAGMMALGTLIAFVRYGERFITPIRTISQEIQLIQEALVSTERVRRMLGEVEEDQTLGADGAAMPLLRGDVEYRNVHMGYQPEREVLHGVTFRVAAGTKVGVVGASGSGKTSTLSLLPRLYPLSSGRILLDGHDLTSLRRDALRAQLGYVGQDAVVVAGSLRDNLLLAVPGTPPSDGELLAACARSGLSEALNVPRILPTDRVIDATANDGSVDAAPDAGASILERTIIDGGENLSMGERQLIAFTRMLLRDPRILILDEATANIDERCERLIQRATDQLMTGRTSFVIAHRLSTIVRCDLILVFANGRIVERGTHAELMRHGGVYAELAGSQLVDVG